MAVDRRRLSRPFFLLDQQGRISLRRAVYCARLLSFLCGRISSSNSLRSTAGPGDGDWRSVRSLRVDRLSAGRHGDGPSLSWDAHVWRHAVPSDNFHVRTASSNSASGAALAFCYPVCLVVDWGQRSNSPPDPTRLASPRKWWDRRGTGVLSRLAGG